MSAVDVAVDSDLTYLDISWLTWVQPWWATAATGVRGARISNLGEHRGWH